MGKQTFTQAEIIEALTGQDSDRRKMALQCMFEQTSLRQTAATYVRKHGGNQQDGEDVFQEAIILFDRKIRQGAFLAQGSLEAYFMGIVRWHWFNQRQRPGQATVSLEENLPEPVPEGDPELQYLLTERREQMEELLTHLSDKCRNVLKMYQLDYSMDEIARALGFANSGVAKKEAFLCRKRFQVLLKTRPEIWSDLFRKEQL